MMPGNAWGVCFLRGEVSIYQQSTSALAVICVNGEFHAGVTTKSLTKILNTYRRKAAPHDDEAA